MPIPAGSVALAGRPEPDDSAVGTPWFPIDPESDTQPIPAIRLTTDPASVLVAGPAAVSGRATGPAPAADPDRALPADPAMLPGYHDPAVPPDAAVPPASARSARIGPGAAVLPAQQPAPGSAAGQPAGGWQLLRAGLVVTLALAIAIALTLALAVAVSGHSGTGGAATRASGRAAGAGPAGPGGRA